MKGVTEHDRALRLQKICRDDMVNHVIAARSIMNEKQASFTISGPGDSTYCAEIVVLRWGHLLVHGDLDAVIFGVCSGYKSWRDVLNWMNRSDYGYAEEKASIGSTCSEMARCFDDEVALSKICQWRRQRYIADRETARELWDHVQSGEWHEAQNMLYGIDFELRLDTVTHPRVFRAIAAIKKLCELLDAEAAAIVNTHAGASFVTQKVDDMDKRVRLTVEQAMKLLDVKGTRVHTIMNPGVNMIVGADWDVERVRSCFEDNGVELAGHTATSMGHGLASKDQGRWVYFATREGSAAEVAS